MKRALRASESAGEADEDGTNAEGSERDGMPTGTSVEVQREGPDDDSGDGSEPMAPELPLDVTFEILKNQRRRLVLRYLDGREGGSTLGDLAEHVAGVENDKPESLLSSSERKRVYIALYQCHLPKLDDAGVVSFDGDRGTITRGDHFDHVINVLRRSERRDGDATATNWPTYYLATALSGAVGVGLVGTAVGDGLASSAVSIVTLGVIVALALAHGRSTS